MKKFFLSSVLGVALIISGLTATSSSAATLHNLASDRCLAVAGLAPGNQKSGTAIIIWDCDGSAGQQWGYNAQGAAFPPPPSNGSYLGWYLVSSVASDRYLTTQAAPCNVQLCGTSVYAGNGSHVFSSSSQGAIQFRQWEMWWQGRDFRSHDCYIIESRADEFTSDGRGPPIVLGVANGNKNNGGQVIMWQQLLTASGGPDFVNHPDQYWCVYN